MNFCIMFVLLMVTKETLQDCVSLATMQYYSRFSRFRPRKYIQCENEIISSYLHTKIKPFTVGAEIRWLQINNTDSPEIAAGAFSTLNMIPDLRINQAGIRVIQPGAFSGLSSLTQLSLKNNKISEVSEECFVNLTYLLELDLSFNNIVSISEKSFTSLKSLQRLTLQNNVLTELSPNTFEGLLKIEILDLSFNKLSSIGDRIFTNLSVLKTLRINNNNLNNFHGSILLNNTSLENLYINSNYLTIINNFSLTNPLNTFNASHNLLQSLSVSKFTIIKTVDLRSNGITSARKLLFKNVAVMELYLDQNHLGLNPIASETFSNLTSLEVISLADNQIKELNLNLFKNNNRVRKLNLAKNYLRSTHLPKLPISLQDLNLSFNNFDLALNITDLIQLKSFDISFNNLNQVSFTLLTGLKGLFSLNLSNNKITNLKLGCFRDLQILRELDISYNNISVLEIGVFVGLDNLYRLDISHNKLTILNDGVFHNLRFLQSLNLNYNNITFSSVDNSLSHLSVLREIGLAGNNLSCSLLTDVLKKYRRVKFINAGDYDVINVDGIACKHKVTDSTNLVNLETKLFFTVNSNLTTTNKLLIIILTISLIKMIIKYILVYLKKNTFKAKLWRNKSEQELQLVNDC